MSLQKKSEKFKKSVDNYRAREYNIRVLATIAQLAEHLIRNERVVGSNPISGSNKIKASEKSEAFFLCLWRYLAAHKNKPGLGTVARVFVQQVLIFLMGIGDVWYGDRAFFPSRQRRTSGRICSRCGEDDLPGYSPGAYGNSSCHR